MKKQLGILTHYQVHNHGAILQMFGLTKTFENMSCNVKILTYSKNMDLLPKEKSAKYNLSLRSIPVYIKYLAERGIKKTIFNFNKYRIMKKFKNSYFDFLPFPEKHLDFACIGSDEVFSLEIGANPVMYGHGIKADKVFSYAGSFGQTGIERIKATNYTALIESGLKTFTDICVRDKNSFEVVKSLTGKEPTICFDPVLLYGFEKELKKTYSKTPKNKYLLIYAYDYNMNSEKEISAIRNYAKKNGLKIVSAGFVHNWADEILNVNPLELLILFKNATCVVTDTFHGAVLSILTNRPFACFKRDMNTNKIGFLLEMLSCQKAEMKDYKDLESILQNNVDYSIVNNRVKEEREKGLNYLKGVING